MTRIEALRSAINALVERSNTLRATLQEYATRDEDPSDEERTQFAQDLADFEAAGPEIERLTGELRALEAVANAPERARESVPAPLQVMTRQDPFAAGVEFRSTSEVRGAARTVVEQVEHVDDEIRNAMQRTLDRAIDKGGMVARHMIVASRPAYRSAFPKLLAGRPDLMTPEERAAEESVRALSLTDASGGYLVPTVVDPTIIFTGTHNGLVAANAIRARADVRQISGDNLTVVKSSGVTVDWVSEGEESNDNSPTLSTLALSVNRCNCFVPYTIEIEQDWPGLEATIRNMIQVAKEDEEANVFALGNGTGKPLGMVYDIYTNYTGQVQASATADTFAVADLYALRNKIAARYQGRGTWMGNQLIMDKIRQFDTAGGGSYWVDLNGANPSSLMGFPVITNPEMDGTYGSGDNYVLVYGDFSGYTIVDRIGLTVEPIPHLFGSNNNFPNGMRGIWAYWRTGARVTNSEALAVLNVT
jgi:HK97 family phage major capsid protein